MENARYLTTREHPITVCANAQRDVHFRTTLTHSYALFIKTAELFRHFLSFFETTHQRKPIGSPFDRSLLVFMFFQC